MDRQARKLQAMREEQTTKDKEAGANSGSEKVKSDSDSAAAKEEVAISDDEEEMDQDDNSKPKCSNCGILCHNTHNTAKGDLCGTCLSVRTLNIHGKEGLKSGNNTPFSHCSISIELVN